MQNQLTRHLQPHLPLLSVIPRTTVASVPGRRSHSTDTAGRLLVLALALFVLSGGFRNCFAQDQNYGPNPPANTLVAQTAWVGPAHQFVTCTLEDATGWWWGTDNDGLWHYSRSAKPGFRWKHVRAEDGLYDDSITSLCLDGKGRLWVGTERRGVSVYNNSWWQNYDYMSGPLGVHVSSIALNPINGDIWIGSEGGIAVYSDKAQSWRYFTVATGLLIDQINCIAFTSVGNVIVGTADNGLLFATPATNYSTWSHLAATPAASASESGKGLPSNQVNCLLINKAGKIFCGTSSGLCYSTDGAKTWTFLHGWEWQLKIKRDVRNALAVDWTSNVLPLSDDYISALAFDQSGFLYIGHRQGGLEVIDDYDGSQQYHTRLHEYGTCIRSLTLLTSNALLIGDYGGGASAIQWTNAKSLAERLPIGKTAITLFPKPAAPPTTKELGEMASQIKLASTAAAPATGYFIGEDWQTQGNWVGRYGTEYVQLLGADYANQDYIAGDQTKFSVSGQIGIALNGASTPSHWLQWEQSGDPRVLYDPEMHVRRESEYDDQGEQDERLVQGPDIWLTVQVPAGMHRLSLYFMNKDGHTETTRFRDFIVQLIPAVTGVDFRATYDSPTLMPAVAETRVENFWPGVYERFAVSGPGTYYVKIDRNYSLNTIVQAVFIDSLDHADTLDSPSWMKGFTIRPSVSTTMFRPSPKVQSIEQLWSQLNTLYGKQSSSPLQRDDRLLLLRAAAAEKAPQSLLTDWRLSLGLWNDSDWSLFIKSLNRMTKQQVTAPKS